MKFAEINAIFTEKVTEMIYNGYVINTMTMGGSQGDIAAVDFRKGEDVIRVRLHKEMHSMVNGKYVWADCIVLTVGRCLDNAVINNVKAQTYLTIWNGELEVLEERTFWQMQDKRDTDWYIEGDEGFEAIEKNNSRRSELYKVDEIVLNGREKAVLPIVRRRLGKEKYSIKNILKVFKVRNKGENRWEYFVATTNHGTIKIA